MFTVGLDVNREVVVPGGILESVVSLQTLDLRFGNGGNLALIRVECSKPYTRSALAAAGAEVQDELLRRRPLSRLY